MNRFRKDELKELIEKAEDIKEIKVVIFNLIDSIKDTDEIMEDIDSKYRMNLYMKGIK